MLTRKELKEMICIGMNEEGVGEGLVKAIWSRYKDDPKGTVEKYSFLRHINEGETV